MNKIDRMIDVKYVDINGNDVIIKDDIYERLIITNIPPRNSASNSIIIEGFLKQNQQLVPIYGKYFKNDQYGLVFERHIYDYIKTIPNIFVYGNNLVNITNVRNDHIIFEYESHDLDRAEKLSYAYGINKHIQRFYNENLYNQLNTVVKGYNITADDPLIGFITISHPNSKTVNECLSNYWGASLAAGGADWTNPTVVDQFLKFMFNLIYNIYLLNIKFDIIHNDCHFGNMLVEDLGENIHNWREVNYILNEHPFKIKQRFIVRIYDFDRSTKVDNNVSIHTPNRLGAIANPVLDKPIVRNLSLCEYVGSCNRYTEIDSNIIIANISHIINIREVNAILLDHLTEIRNVLLNNHAGLINAYNTSSIGTQPHMHWSGFCGYDNNTGLFIPARPDRTITCENTDAPFIDIKTVLYRYINKYLIRDDSGQELRSFYNVANYGGNMKQKYLKYKQKYLNLKKKLNK
jgi:hypothetical protein